MQVLCALPSEAIEGLEVLDGQPVEIDAGTLSLADGARISSRTLNSAAGGDVRVNVADIVDVSRASQITAGTAGSGAGGNLDVRADSIFISAGVSESPSIIGAESTSTGAGGRGGDVFIDTRALHIVGARGSETGVSAKSFGAGTSGSVRMELQTLELDSSAFIGSSNAGSGKAGSVLIHSTGGIHLDGGSVITTSSAQNDAGIIDVSTGTGLELAAASNITASAGRNGGSIRLVARDFFYLLDSSVTATAGTSLAAGGAGGAGGNIFIDPTFIILDHALISANAALGAGGNIFLGTENFLSSSSLITATGATAGTVVIAAPELDLAGALVTLPVGLVDASIRLREQCAVRLGLNFSSFLVVGRGGVAPAPDDLADGLGRPRMKSNKGVGAR